MAGCAPLLDRDCRSALVFDIGGGSTELIWVSMDDTTSAVGERSALATKPRIEDWISLPCGVVTLAEGPHLVKKFYETIKRRIVEINTGLETMFNAKVKTQFIDMYPCIVNDKSLLQTIP